MVANKAEEGLLVVAYGKLLVVLAFVAFCKDFCNFCFFKVNLYNLLVKVPYLVVICFLVEFCKLAECEFVLRVFL